MFVLLKYLVAIVGIYIFSRGMYSLWLIIQEIFLLKEKDHLTIYGQNSWALITGSTDGIGLEFARQLAKRGFNIIISARNPEKLLKRKQEIQAEFPKIKIKTLEADYSKIYEKDYVKNLWKKVEDLDISLLVNNVGIGLKKISFLKSKQEQAHRLVTVNCSAQVLMTRFFREKNQERKQRCAIVDLSSTVSLAPLRNRELYSATKVFNERFSMVKWYHHRDRIDHLIVKPGFVQTPLTDNRPIDLLTCTVDECVNGSLKALGHRLITFGATKHILFGSFVQALFFLFPYSFLERQILSRLRKKKSSSDDSKKLK